MDKIESALKHVIETSPANTFNNANPVVEAVMRHVDANEELTEALNFELSREEQIALFNSLLEIFTDSLDDEMKVAADLIQQRLGYV
jgi:hypothetical protein